MCSTQLIYSYRRKEATFALYRDRIEVHMRLPEGSTAVTYTLAGIARVYAYRRSLLVVKLVDGPEIGFWLGDAVPDICEAFKHVT